MPSKVAIRIKHAISSNLMEQTLPTSLQLQIAQLCMVKAQDLLSEFHNLTVPVPIISWKLQRLFNYCLEFPNNMMIGLRK
jgi:hypothetical protein